jgi:hypothetical protein
MTAKASAGSIAQLAIFGLPRECPSSCGARLLTLSFVLAHQFVAFPLLLLATFAFLPETLKQRVMASNRAVKFLKEYGYESGIGRYDFGCMQRWAISDAWSFVVRVFPSEGGDVILPGSLFVLAAAILGLLVAAWRYSHFVEKARRVRAV